MEKGIVMGSYAHCWLDKLLVGTSKNDIDSELISLFRPQDKIVKGSLKGDVPNHLKHYAEYLDEDAELNVVYYEAPVHIIKDRLDILGYNLQTVKEAFGLWIEEELNRTSEGVAKWKDIASSVEGEFNKKFPTVSNDIFEGCKSNYEILSKLTSEVWIECLQEINLLGLKTNYYGRYQGPHEKTTIGYMLSNDWYGYPGNDVFVPLRLAIEAFKDSKTLIYDLTDLVWSEYFNYSEDFVGYGLNVSAYEYNSKSKTIVLTEGKSDTKVLSEALEILYPHLKDYYSFLDFEGTDYGGGVGNLSNLVKAFSGSGIINNVIALFDNDTAAHSACKKLLKIGLPENISIVMLPTIDLLKSYPTLGPYGAQDVNVNGMAASIELYFGEDILKIDGENLTPIQWTGYDKSENQYQGEVLEKAKLQKRFNKKIAEAKKGKVFDWNELHLIFDLIFNAFSEKNRKIICNRPNEYYSR